jgi:hypothetical protein
MGSINNDVKIISLGDLLLIKFTNENTFQNYQEITDITEVDIERINKPVEVSDRAINGLIKCCLATKGCCIIQKNKAFDKSDLIFQFRSKKKTISKRLGELTMPQIILLRVILES